MKNIRGKVIILFSIFLATFVIIAVNPVYADAKVKNGTYYFSSCMTTTFKVKGGKMTLKVTGTEGITKKGSSSFKKKKMTVKVAKNCKYYNSYFMRGTGESGKSKSTYSQVKKNISFDRSWYKENGYYNNAGLSSFVVKKGKIVKIIYFSM